MWRKIKKPAWRWRYGFRGTIFTDRHYTRKLIFCKDKMRIRGGKSAFGTRGGASRNETIAEHSDGRATVARILNVV
jgi:hypothetical protein